MTDYTWAFDKSFLVFLIIAGISVMLSVKVRSLIPMPLIYGILFILGFAFHLLPADMLLSANMIAVGTIAYNVLVVHSGTMIDLHFLKKKWEDALVCIISTFLLVLTAGFGLMPFVGKELALLSPGSVVGGGASCAIASRLMMQNNPEYSVFPWMIFMFQGVFSVPVITLALKKESQALAEEFRKRKVTDAPAGSVFSFSSSGTGRRPLCERIPKKYKSTAYYLGIIMAVTFFNNLLHGTLFSDLSINPYITALLFGMVFHAVGFMDRAPLFSSDSYGLLILGLMGLMANTLANCPWQAVVGYLPALLLVFVVSTAVLILCGAVAAKIFGFRPWRGIALTMNCMMGFPVNDMLLEQASRIGENEEEQIYIKSQLGSVLGMGTMLISNGFSLLVVILMGGLL
ncbi:hypothetical protein [Fusibacillus kribbianus]|uniref:Uncharacterized protein n=1 Tax=Fusibacillus kribbianus TaxID=3044208 RepID=A0AAP4B952_9FIRM|nr:hypothetical protein [Ruminococcus sp. YH-rum2234]MDI9241517.1 hypothetical protein [Ruminococcus sp. YH-rum2234]